MKVKSPPPTAAPDFSKITFVCIRYFIHLEERAKNLYMAYLRVIVNFMCQLDCVTGCPQIKHYFWLYMWRCFQMRLVFELVDSVDCPPHCRWVLCSPLSAWIEQKCRGRKNSPLLLSVCLPARTRVSVFCLWAGVIPVGSPYSQAFEFSGLHFLGLQLADSRLWNFSAFLIMEANSQ